MTDQARPIMPDPVKLVSRSVNLAVARLRIPPREAAELVASITAGLLELSAKSPQSEWSWYWQIHNAAKDKLGTLSR